GRDRGFESRRGHHWNVNDFHSVTQSLPGDDEQRDRRRMSRNKRENPSPVAFIVAFKLATTTDQRHSATAFAGFRPRMFPALARAPSSILPQTALEGYGGRPDDLGAFAGEFSPT